MVSLFDFGLIHRRLVHDGIDRGGQLTSFKVMSRRIHEVVHQTWFRQDSFIAVGQQSL